MSKFSKKCDVRHIPMAEASFFSLKKFLNKTTLFVTINFGNTLNKTIKCS